MGQFGSHFGGNFDTYDDSIEFTIGDTDLRITKEGHVQIKSKKGIALLPEGFKVKRGDNAIKLNSAFTTISTSWVDVTGLSFNVLETMIGKKESMNISKALSSLKKHKKFFKNLMKSFPLEIESVVLNFGFFKAKYRRKKKSAKSDNQ